MYTVEFESDSAIITSLDETAEFADIRLVIGDDNTVYITQDDEVFGDSIITISYQQLLDLFAAMRSPEGAFYTRLINGGGYGKMGST